MVFENGKLKWRINPLTINFEDEKVINNFAFYIDMVKQVQYDPQKVVFFCFFFFVVVCFFCWPRVFLGVARWGGHIFGGCGPVYD